MEEYPENYIYRDALLCPIFCVIDVDSFEVQLHQKKEQWKDTVGKPVIMVNPISKRIISVSPEAKNFSISRKDKETKAFEKCPELVAIPVDMEFDKPSSRLQREACRQLRKATTEFVQLQKTQDGMYSSEPLGKCRIYGADVPIAVNGWDEIILDMTEWMKMVCTEAFRVPEVNLNPESKIVLETTGRFKGVGLRERLAYHEKNINPGVKKNRRFEFIPKWRFRYNNDEYRYLLAMERMEDLRAFVKEKTDLQCSVGIGSNKIRAKLACKLAKPNGSTAIMDDAVLRVAKKLSFRDIPGFGGDLGERVYQAYGDLTMRQLQEKCRDDFPQVVRSFGEEEAKEIRSLAYAEHEEDMQKKMTSKMMNCGKTQLCFTKEHEFKQRLWLLCEEMAERIGEEEEFNCRRPTEMRASYVIENNSAKSCFLPLDKNENGEIMCTTAGRLYDECLNQLFTCNPLFSDHLPHIREMKVSVVEFRSRGFVYQDKVKKEARRKFHSLTGKHPSYYGVGIDSDDEEDECRATHAMLKTYPANFTDSLC